MPGTLLLRLQEGKIKLLEEAVEAWKADHDNAMQALDAEDLVADVLTLANDGLPRTWTRIWKILETVQSIDTEVIGMTLREVFDRVPFLLVSVRAVADQTEASTGHTLKGRIDLDAAIERVLALRSSILSAWPWKDRPYLPQNSQMIRESREAFSRGEYDDITTLLQQAQSGEHLGGA